MNVADAAAELHQRTKRTWACIRAESQGRDWSNHPCRFKVCPDLEPLWLPCELPESSVAATEVLAGHVLATAGALDLAGLARLLCFSAGVTRFLQDVLFRAAPRPARCTRRRWTWSAAPLAACPPGWTASSRPSWSCVGCKRGTSGPAWPPPPRSRLSLGAAVPGGHRDPWRTTWRYGQRGWRHLFWDAGAIVATCWRWLPRPGGARACCSALWTRRSPAWSASAGQRSTRFVLVGVEAPTVSRQPAAAAGAHPPKDVAAVTLAAQHPSSAPPSAPVSSPAPRRSPPGATRPPGSRPSRRPRRVLSATPARLALPRTRSRR